MSQDNRVQLERANSILTMERDALVRERDFWVNQSRALQNQVQMWQAMYSGLLKEIAVGEVRPNVAEAVNLATEALEIPLTPVEAIRALQAQMRPSTQGAYTARIQEVREGVPGLVDKIRRLGSEAKARRKER